MQMEAIGVFYLFYILFDIINHVEAAGFPVIPMVCDMGPTNIRMWNSLIVGIGKPSFTNSSSDDREIFVFADSPHLLKLIRNNFLDSGFQMDGSDGHINVNVSVRELIKRRIKDLRITYWVDDRHVEVQLVTLL